jgi:hypothetical protein
MLWQHFSKEYFNEYIKRIFFIKTLIRLGIEFQKLAKLPPRQAIGVRLQKMGRTCVRYQLTNFTDILAYKFDNRLLLILSLLTVLYVKISDNYGLDLF